MAATESTKNIKIWKATNKSNAGMMVTERAAFLIGTSKNFVVASDKGVGIAGKSISFMTTSENIRQGGLWIQMNDFAKMIPSTLISPLPYQIPFPPAGLITSVAKDLPFFLAMLV